MSSSLLSSFSQLSPYASLKPMKPSVFTPLSAIDFVTAVAISESFCGILNAQRRFASIGSTIEADAASAIIGVCDSAITSSIASAFAVVFGPTITSTSSSAVSLRALITAPVGVEPSSSTTYSIFWPAISVGHIETTFLLGAPIDAAGPVVDRSTPTLICADAALVNSAAHSAANADFVP